MKKIFKRGMSGLLAVLMAFTVLAGFGTTTAFAASETAESYMISFPRDGDAAQIYSEDAWGHSAKNYMNGWATGSSNYTTLHCMDSFDGKVCYCIEPGLSRNVGDTYHGFGEDFWDNYPSQYNNTIEPDDIKLLLGRIMQYGYQGNLSTSWRSQNDSDADKLAHAFATQLLVWETVVGERDADFDHVSTGGYDEILSLVSPNHPLYSRIMDYYDSIESSVQSHAVCPSFMSRSSGGAKTIELAWDGSQYIAELTDTNHVLSQFTFSASETGFHFSVSGNTLTITTDTAPTSNVTISASRSASRCGVLVWTDYKYGPNGGVQDTITYTASVSDPVRAFLKLKVSYGGAKIIKTSEDGRVDGICYRRDWLNQHLKDAEKGIRFIDSHYKELFRIPDGGKVKIHYSWNEEQIRTCRYIDDYHVEIGSNLYHICEFAERMEYGGHTCEPVRDNLPEQCYSVLSGSDEIIIIKRGEKGYFKTDIPVTDKDEARSIVNEYNAKLGVSKAQEEAMKAGSMFGFQVPAADPRNYDAGGNPVMPKDRGDAR